MEKEVPLERVMEDMLTSDNDLVRSAAKAYYYCNYMTDEEKEAMYKEERFYKKVTAICLVLFFIILIGSVLINI